MRIGICGIAGKMGTAILSVSLQRGHTISQGLEAPGSQAIGLDAGTIIGTQLGVKIEELSSASLNAEVIIDFSSPNATEVLLEKAVNKKIPLVIGTTGHNDVQKELVKKASEIIPIVFSPNMSVGVNLLFKLTHIAATILQEGYDVEIFEAHHRMKKDSPSGTAKKLIDIVMSAREDLRSATLKHGREGLIGERTNNEIGVMVMRGGDIVGEHTVYFVANGERLELTHRATSRENFARGAVKAAEFVVHQKQGLYTMFDVLGIL